MPRGLFEVNRSSAVIAPREIFVRSDFRHLLEEFFEIVERIVCHFVDELLNPDSIPNQNQWRIRAARDLARSLSCTEKSAGRGLHVGVRQF
jgi:hypothetical protein